MIVVTRNAQNCFPEAKLFSSMRGKILINIKDEIFLNKCVN